MTSTGKNKTISSKIEKDIAKAKKMFEGVNTLIKSLEKKHRNKVMFTINRNKRGSFELNCILDFTLVYNQRQNQQALKRK